jgi:hypothetical protein
MSAVKTATTTHIRIGALLLAGPGHTRVKVRRSM